MLNNVCLASSHGVDDFCDQHNLRDQLIERVDVLQKVKSLFLIPKLEMMTTQMVADFYEVQFESVNTVYHRNQDEIDSDGTQSMKFSELKSFCLVQNEQDKNSVNITNKQGYALFNFDGNVIRIANGGNKFFSPRAVLRIGMLLRDSKVAKEVRTQLLNTFEVATDEQRTEAINKEDSMLLAMFYAKDDVDRATRISEYVAYKNRYINQLESEKSNLNTELGVAYNKFSAWDSRQIVQALISSLSQTIQAQSSLRFPYAWSRLRKHLLKHCGINLESRRTISGQTRRPYIDFVRENEWDVVMQEAYVLAKDAGVDIVRCVGKTNAKMLEIFLLLSLMVLKRLVAYRKGVSGYDGIFVACPLIA